MGNFARGSKCPFVGTSGWNPMGNFARGSKCPFVGTYVGCPSLDPQMGDGRPHKSGVGVNGVIWPAAKLRPRPSASASAFGLGLGLRPRGRPTADGSAFGRTDPNLDQFWVFFQLFFAKKNSGQPSASRWRFASL